MRPDGFSQLGAHNHTRTFGSRATTEQHDPAAHVYELGLQQADANTKSNSGTPQRALVVGNGPWVPLQLFECVGELKFALRHGEKESCAGTRWHGGSSGLLRSIRARAQGTDSKHFLDLLGCVVFASAEDE
jgi:hypothetical protein